MHLSMRVPWMDRPWDEAVCNNPTANSSCVLHDVSQAPAWNGGFGRVVVSVLR